MSCRLRSALLATSLLLSAAVSGADPVTWFLSDVRFDDGGTASGSFVFDADTQAFSNVDITTTDGNMRLGVQYTFPSLLGTAAMPDFLNLEFPIQNGVTSRLSFLLAGSMTNAGGVLDIRSGQEFTCLDENCTFLTGDEDGLNLRRASGSLQASVSNELPEPGSFALVGLAAFAALATRRRLPRA